MIKSLAVVGQFLLITAVSIWSQNLSASSSGNQNTLPTIVLPNDINFESDTSGYGAARDSIQQTLGDVPSLQQLCTLSTQVSRDVYKYQQENHISMYTVPADTVYGIPSETNTYEMIKAYCRLLSFGVPLSGKMPNLIRTRAITDSTSNRILPKKPGTGAIENDRFFFLGGGPFIYKRELEGGVAYKDLQGRAEARYTCDVSENTEFSLRMMRRFAHVRFDVQTGPPCGSYDSGPQSVRGIGSLRHVLLDRVPAYLITKQGVVPAEMVSITKKLFYEDLCVSNMPTVEFGCAQPPNGEILAIYIPYDSVSLEKCIVKKKGRLWTADLNGDGFPDFAGVSHTFAGSSSDTMADIIWYVNVNGKWRIVDTASEMECS